MDVKFIVRSYHELDVFIDIIINDVRKTFLMRQTYSPSRFDITVRVDPNTDVIQYAVYTEHANYHNVNMRVIKQMRKYLEGSRILDKEKERYKKQCIRKRFYSNWFEFLRMEKIVYF